MHNDILDLREFYHSPLGLITRRILRQHVLKLWPSLKGERVLILGYGTPLIRPYIGEGATFFAMMPAKQGVAFWPREGPNIATLVDTHNLPLPDNSVDRVILLHALEGEHAPDLLWEEVWRVLKSSGQLLAIVPNRRGLWAHSDHTPFGSGQPYSRRQIAAEIKTHGFAVDHIGRALFLPPFAPRLMHGLADFLEKYGERLFPGFAGVLVVEASKQLYAPLLTKELARKHRLILPLPLPQPLNPTPAGRGAATR